jgi:hypothetical protein
MHGLEYRVEEENECWMQKQKGRDPSPSCGKLRIAAEKMP